VISCGSKLVGTSLTPHDLSRSKRKGLVEHERIYIHIYIYIYTYTYVGMTTFDIIWQ